MTDQNDPDDPYYVCPALQLRAGFTDPELSGYADGVVESTPEYSEGEALASKARSLEDDLASALRVLASKDAEIASLKRANRRRELQVQELRWDVQRLARDPEVTATTNIANENVAPAPTCSLTSPSVPSQRR